MTIETVPAKKSYQIVVGFDFSELSERAIEAAFAMAARNAPSEIHVVTVGHHAGALVRLPGEAEAISDELARETVRLRIAQVIDDYQKRHAPVAVDRIALYVLAGLPIGGPAGLIVELANSVDADVIVVGTHGRSGVARMLLGSVAQQVVREAGCSIYVVRPPDFVRGKKVPEIQPPLAPGEPHLKRFEHRRTYHYVDKVSHWTDRTMPVS